MVDKFHSESGICGVKLEEIPADISSASTVDSISAEVPGPLSVDTSVLLTSETKDVKKSSSVNVFRLNG